MIFIYTTFSTKRDAKKAISTLLSYKLIACANVFPIESTYVWKGKIVSEKECAVLVKTTAARYVKTARMLEKIHPYDVPIVAKISARANAAYEYWLSGLCK